MIYQYSDFCIELNPHRRHDQAVLMREALGEDAKYVHWVDEVPDGFKGYILAHEIIDALPAKRVGYLNGVMLNMVFSGKMA